MSEVKERLNDLQALKWGIRNMLDLADQYEEHMLAIALDQTLHCISDRIETLRRSGVL